MCLSEAKGMDIKMKTVSANNWSVLNNIIYKIYTTKDADKMRKNFLEQMKMVLDFDSAEFYLTDLEDSSHFSQPIKYNCEIDGEGMFYEMLKKSTLSFLGKSIVFLETDIMPAEVRQKASFYKEYYVVNNWQYSLHLLLGDGTDCVGLVTLYRTIGKENFDSDDMFVLDLMKEHLLFRLSEERKERESLQEKLTVSEASEKYHLTKRESTILRMLMKGKDNNTISEELQISVNTLKKHILNIYRKLNINNRVQLFKMIKEKE